MRGIKTKSILIALILTSILFTSCNKDGITPSNNVTTVDKIITGYDQLSVSDQFIVYVTFSDTAESIKIEANTNLQQYITCEKQSDWLVIHLANDLNIDGSVVLNVYITTKRIYFFEGYGTSKIHLQNELIDSNLFVRLFDASTFNGTVHVNKLFSYLSFSSNLNLEGNSESFDIEAIDASSITSFDFETSYFTANLEGASNIYSTVNNELDVTASGASNVYYKGNGVIVNQILSGGSQIIKMD